MKKAQVSMEVMMVIGVVLLITIPLVSNILYDVAVKAGDEGKVNKLMSVAHTMETVANLGPGNAVDIVIGKKMVVSDNIMYIGEVSEDVISVKIVPKIEDTEIDKGKVLVVNSGGEIIVVHEPWIEDVNQDGSVLRINGDYYEEYSNVIADGNSLEPDTVSENEITISVNKIFVLYGEVIEITLNELYVENEVEGYKLNSNKKYNVDLVEYVPQQKV